MKRVLFITLAVCICLSPALGGLVKKTKSQAVFRGFGTFSVVLDEKMTADRKAQDSQAEFKGKGVLGSVAGKTILRSGSFGEIVNLPDMTVTRIDHKKKTYQVEALKPLEASSSGTGGPASQAEKEKAEESEIKIIRSEFHVEASGEKKDINQFPCSRYAVSWIVDWENVRTSQKGQDKMLTDVWTTPLSGSLKAAQAEEALFAENYMKALGLSGDEREKDILGTAWLELLQSFKPTDRKPKQDTSRFASELAKIKGYPIVIDGRFFSVTEAGTQQEAEEEKSGGVLGGLSKKFLKKKSEEPTNEPALSWYSEVLAVETTDVPPEAFLPPADYKKKD